MNKVSRTITGGVIIILSLLWIVFIGILNSHGVDYFAIILGVFFLVIGFIIFFNNKEDEIEKIKKKK